MSSLNALWPHYRHEYMFDFSTFIEQPPENPCKCEEGPLSIMSFLKGIVVTVFVFLYDVLKSTKYANAEWRMTIVSMSYRSWLSIFRLPETGDDELPESLRLETSLGRSIYRKKTWFSTVFRFFSLVFQSFLSFCFHLFKVSCFCFFHVWPYQKAFQRLCFIFWGFLSIP